MKMIPTSPRAVDLGPNEHGNQHQHQQHLKASLLQPQAQVTPDTFAFAYPPSSPPLPPSPTLRQRAHTEEQFNRPRLLTQQQEQQAQEQEQAQAQQLPMAPCLDNDQTNTHHHHRRHLYSDENDHSTVSSVSNTSWERYQKLRDRQGWIPPPPPEHNNGTLFLPTTPLVPPAMICFQVKPTKNRQSASNPILPHQNNINNNEKTMIPDWLRDTVAPTKPTTRTSRRAQTMPSEFLTAVARQAANDWPEPTTTTTTTTPVMWDAMQAVDPVHPLLRDTAPPTARTTTTTMTTTTLTESMPHQTGRFTRNLRDDRNRRSRRSRRSRNRGNSDQMHAIMTHGMGQLELHNDDNNYDNVVPAMPVAPLAATSTFPLPDEEAAQLLELLPFPTRSSPVPSDNNDNDDDEEEEEEDEELSILQQQQQQQEDNDTTRTHFNVPALLWDKCVKSPVQKALGNHHRHHRRSQSYDFKASPSACFS